MSPADALARLRRETFILLRSDLSRRAPTVAAYRLAAAARQKAVRQNASRRMRGLLGLPLPEAPLAPLAWIAYESSGDYCGRLDTAFTAPMAEALAEAQSKDRLATVVVLEAAK